MPIAARSCRIWSITASPFEGRENSILGGDRSLKTPLKPAALSLLATATRRIVHYGKTETEKS